MSLPEHLLTMMRQSCVCGEDWPCDDTQDVDVGDPDHHPVISDNDMHWEICGRCDGEGTLRGWPGTYTESDRAEWSDEDYEDYQAFRRCCEDCLATGKVKVLSEAAENRREVREWIDDWYDTESIYRMERMCGA